MIQIIASAVLFVLAMPSVFFSSMETARAAILEPTPQIEVVPQEVCYAYLRSGDLWTVCQGKREHFSLKRNAFEFAISADGTFLAYLEDMSKLRQKATDRNDLTLVSLSPGFKTKKTRTEFARLHPTCGTILQPGQSMTPETDILSGKNLAFEPYLDFRCSSDQHVLAGVAKGTVLNEPIDLQLLLDGKLERGVKISSPNGGAFDVSPNGKYLGYFRRESDQYQVCVAEQSAQPSCVNADWALTQVAVSDAGGILYSAGASDKECKDDEPCLRWTYWRPGLPRPVVLDRDDGQCSNGRCHRAQWITPETAKRLHEWAVSLTLGTKSDRH